MKLKARLAVSRFRCPVHLDCNVHWYDTNNGMRFLCFECGEDIVYTLDNLPTEKKYIDNVIWSDKED